MLRMFRVRGKRVWFLIFAACATFLIFRWSRETEQILDHNFHVPDKKEQYGSSGSGKQAGQEGKVAKVVEETKRIVQTLGEEVVPMTKSTSKEVVATPAVIIEETASSTPPPVPTIPPVVLPDRQKGPPSDINGIPESDEYLHPSEPKGRQDFPVFSATTTIHWQRQVEHFPVPTESIIHLPTGEPVRIPKIQFDFKDETTDAKISREKRQAKVKSEFRKAWKGYREKAWLHDEISPVTGSFRDPFCGWAATLVDGLDTLWIMGLETAFEDAVKGVSQLDFTTSFRGDIPMFETTIRYLGGLISAYDVSGKKYKVLLDKAVELADVLLGAFDTPNRMPILFYRWKPAFASQAKRASTYSNTAELGSMTLEFTRLAQLTREPRYYDAVARITNALSEWQDRGTELDGVFPDSIDASGCNRTEVSTPMEVSANRGPIGEPIEKPQGYQPLEEERKVGKPAPGGTSKPEQPDISELQILPGNPSRAKFMEKNAKQPNPIDPATQFRKRDVTEVQASSNETTSLVSGNDPDTGLPLRQPPTPLTDSTRYSSSTTLEDWDCKPKGLESSNPTGRNKFSMGGGQDSTYEYMPKQHLLLGGHEKKYGKMYLKAIESVRRYMLFRPMIPGDRDILFSGAIEKWSIPKEDMLLSPEVEHLTCFIGGMVGMSAKIFEIEGDLELAKRLTDGCVWAYESFPSGIMPESATVAVCKDKNDCRWDEKAYRLILDPMGDSRDGLVDEYLENRKAAKLQQEQADKAAAEAANVEAEAKPQSQVVGGGAAASRDALLGENVAPVQQLKPAESPIGSAELKKEEPVSLQKRSLEEEILEKKDIAEQPVEKPAQVVESLPEKSEPRPNTDAKPVSNKPAASDAKLEASDRSGEETDSSNSLHGISQSEKEYDDYVRVNEVASGREAEVPLANPATTKAVTPPDPALPLNHKQWVDARIEQENLPPGFTSIRSRKYILRPEAIESVWYMYRITGDRTWQDKGWKMFESVIAATSAQFGHSAIFDVTMEKPQQIDEMESFWLAETLKYFYLLFSTPDVVSLDEWVLNTEAHPFKREVV